MLLSAKYLLASAIVGGCPVVFIFWTIKTIKDRRDGDRIYQFLCRSVKDGQCRFRSSEAISAVTNLPISRIADLCTKHFHIERKEQERHTWRVISSGESHHAVIRVYDEAGDVIETHEHTGDFKEP
jgi:predicted metal-binding protein